MKKDDMTIQEKIDKLDELEAWFQGDEFKLEDAKDKLKLAADLAGQIEVDLQAAANEVNEIKQSFRQETSES